MIGKLRSATSCIVLALTLGLLTPARAQIVEKYRDMGSDSLRLTIVITGDGYTSGQQSQFRNDAVNLTNYLLTISPWDTYAASTNVYFVGAISNQSGADQPPLAIYRDTIFDASFWIGGIERLLAVDDTKVFLYVVARVPTYDFVFVLVNDTKYGGSGGSVSVTSLHAQAPEILVHEVGHSFAQLADEYVSYSGSYTGSEPSARNVTKQTNRNLIKWRAFIQPSTPIPTTPPNSYPTQVGLFEGAYYYPYGVYRPKLNCRMRSLGVGYCLPCVEAHALSIHDYASLVDAVLPVPGTRNVSTVETYSATGNGYQYLDREWLLDGAFLGDGPSVTISPLHLQQPSSTLALHISDNTPFVANYPRPTANYQWSLYPNVTSLASVAQTRLQADGAYVRFPGIVSAFSSDEFFVQSPDRIAGIRVVKSALVSVEVGASLDLAGKLDASGPVLTLTEAEWDTDPASPTPPLPIGLNGRTLGGAALGLQRAVKGGGGLNNIGILVKLAGIVTYVDPGNDYFYLDDAGNIDDGSGHTGVKVFGQPPVGPGEDAVGKCMSAIGISSCEQSGAEYVRVLRTREPGDIRVWQ